MSQRPPRSRTAHVVPSGRPWWLLHTAEDSLAPFTYRRAMPKTPSQQEGSSSASSAAKKKKARKANRLSLTKQKADARRRAARASELESPEDTPSSPPVPAADEMGDADPAAAAAAVDDDAAAAAVMSSADLPMEDGEPAANGTPRSPEPAPNNTAAAAAGMHQQEEDADAARGGDADASANVTKARSAPSWAATAVDRDVISAFQLRTVLATDVPFLSAWHVMESLGWRHKGGMYSTPEGKRAGSSIEAFEMLDRYGGIRPRGAAVPTAVAGVGSEEEEEEARTMRRIRDELLEGYCRYHKFKAEERQKKKRRRKREEEEEMGEGEGTANNEDEAGTKKTKSSLEDDESLGSGLFSIGGGSAASSSPSASSAKTPEHSDPGDGGAGADAEHTDAASANSRGARSQPKRAAKTRSMGGGDRGAEAYLQNKVQAVTKRATQQSHHHDQEGGVNADHDEMNREDADNVVPEDDDDDEPEHHVWPNLEHNVATVRDYAVKLSNERGVQALDDDYVPCFDEWRFLLSTNHSVLLHGFGSKRSLLNDFAETILPHDGDVLTLDGYDRTINIGNILTVLVQLYLGGHEPRPRSVVSLSGDRATSMGLGIVPPTQSSHAVVRRAFAIGERLASTRSFPIYIVLHNIDGVGLRYRPAQDALATLVASSATSDGIRMIRLASSVDHVNAPATLWSTQTRAAFGWIWKEVHTYRPSFEEVRLGGEEGPIRKTRYGSGLGAGGHRASTSGGGDGMGFMRVLESIGKRHAEALKVLAKEQYKIMKEQERNARLGGAGGRKRSSKPPQPTISYDALKRLCIGKMCASDDTGLRNMLTELTDHGIIAAKNLDDGRHLFIPHPKHVLKQILMFNPDAD